MMDSEQTDVFKEFEYNLNRIEAYYTEICEMENNLKQSVRDLAQELTIIQLVAMADAFRTGIMTYLFLQRTDLLAESKCEISFAEILDSGTWQDLISYIISLETNEWTQLGFGNWISRLKKQHLLPSLSIDPKDRNQLEEIIATRNVLIHNRGLIDEEYIRRSRHWYGMMQLQPPVLQAPRYLDKEYYIEAAICIKRIVTAIDREVISTLSNSPEC